MALVISPDVVTIVEQSATDVDTACAGGIESPAGTSYTKSDGKTFAVDQYTTITSPNVPAVVDSNGIELSPAVPGKSNTEIRNQVKDSTKLSLAPVIKNLRISGSSSATINFTNYSFTDTETTLSTTSAEFVSPRKVLVHASFSLYTNVVDTAINYFIKLNGAQIGFGRFLIGAALVHTSVSGSWVFGVPSGTHSFVLSARRIQGTGILYVDGWDTTYLSVIG